MKNLITLLTVLFVGFSGLLAQPQKVVLVEEGTGTWCQWCPRGEVYAKELADNYPGQYVFVAVHAGDVMESTEYYESTGLTALPSGQIDRSFSSQLDPFSEIHADMSQQLALTPPASIAVATSWEESTREMTITLTADFEEALTGDYRLATIVVEDGVTGPPPSYSQSNQYAGGGEGPMGGYESLPNPIPAGIMVYNHVGRAVPGGYNGAAESLPNTIEAGSTHSFSYSYTVPEAYDEEYIHALGLLINAATGQVLNAGKSAYATGQSNGLPFFHSDGTGIGEVDVSFLKTIICHDPDYDQLEITGDAEMPDWLSVEMINADQAELTGTPPAPGTYTFTLEVTDGIDTRMQEFTLEVIEAAESWMQLGMPSFSNAISEYRADGAVDPHTEEVYAMSIDGNNVAWVYHFDGTAWSQIGNSLPAGSSLYGDLAINPSSGEPWVYLRTGVYRYDGSGWTQVGGVPMGDSHMNIVFTAAGVPYIGSAGGGVGVFFHRLENGQWVSIGSPTGDFLYSWTRLAINQNDQIVALLTEFPSWTGYSKAFALDGDSWVALGDRINPEASTSGSASSLHQLAVGADGTPYAMLGHDSGSNIYRWDGAEWTIIAESIDGGVRESFDLEIGQNGDLFAVYLNVNGKHTCERWDGTDWSYVGSPDFTPTGSDIELFTFPDGLPGVVYMDLSESQGKLSAKRYQSLSTSTEELETGQILRVYPNPASTRLYFSEALPDAERYILMDVQGRQLASGLIRNNSLEVAALSKGLYFLQLTKSGVTIKFVK